MFLLGYIEFSNHCSIDVNINDQFSWYSQLPPCGHLAITDTPLLQTAAKSPVKVTDVWLINSSYYGLSLLRTYGYFIRSQRHNFIVFSLVIADTEREYLHTYQVYFFCFLRLSLSLLVDFRFFRPSIKIPSSFSLKALFAISLPWISSSSLSKYFLLP